MKNANWTRILTILLSLLALYALMAVLAGIVQRFIVPLLLVVLASILAFILTPLVDLIQKRFHIFRGGAILSTYLLVALILLVLGYFMTSPLVAQTRQLSGAIKNPTHIESVLQAETTSAQIVTQATAQVNDYNSWPATVLHNYKLCSPLYFLGEETLPLATQPPCRGPFGYWPLTFGRSWRASLGPPLPALLGAMQRDIKAFQDSSVAPTPAEVLSRHSHRSILSTKIPSSYSEPVTKAYARLASDIAIGQRHLQTGVLGQFLIQDMTTILKDSKSLQSATKTLRSTVATTPIIILALQAGIDGRHLPIDIRKAFGSAVGKLRSQSTTVLNNAVTILTSTLNVVFDLIIVIIMSLYLLADGGRFIRWIMNLVPEQHKDQAWYFVLSLNRVLGGYIRGQLIVAITVGILAGVGCYVLGVPYALLIGIFALIAESIPVIGPVLASVPAILVALFTLPFPRTLLVAGWFLLIQQVEQNVVGPRITGRAVGIHPVAAMIAVIIGLEVGGFWGAFLAVPVTGILFVIVAQAYSYLVLRQPLPTSTVPESMEMDDPTDGGAAALSSHSGNDHKTT